MQRQRAGLPAADCALQIVEMVAKNQVRPWTRAVEPLRRCFVYFVLRTTNVLSGVREALPPATCHVAEPPATLLTTWQVVVVSGETGSGKTTQVPQFIFDDAIARGRGDGCNIICTQPRRISATSAASRRPGPWIRSWSPDRSVYRWSPQNLKFTGLTQNMGQL